MSKTITLRCPECGKKKSFKVGADSRMAALKDVAALIEDGKETEKIVNLLVELESLKPAASNYVFYLNHAEYLSDIDYDSVGAGSHLFKAETLAANQAYQKLMTPPVSDKIAEGKARWAKAAAAEGTMAFYGIYYCKKCGRPENKLFLRVKYQKGGTQTVYSPAYKCGKCGDALVLLDDDNCGFVHEGTETVTKCGCGKKFLVDSVTFGAK